jgi:hypothetical protein
MKKFAIASIIALAATAASALEVGVTTTSDYSGADKRAGYGFTVGKQTGALSVTGGFERFTKGANDQDRFSVTAGYDIAKFGPVTVTPKVAVAYLNNQTSADGYALAVGVGATVPLNKAIDFTLDASRQYGQKRVQDSDGNAVVAGLKYKF